MDTTDRPLGSCGMTRTLTKAAYPVTVCDLDREKVDALAALGASIVAMPAETVKTCQITIVSLPTPGTFISVAESPDGLIAGISEGKISGRCRNHLSTEDPKTRRDNSRKWSRPYAMHRSSGDGKGTETGTLAVMIKGRDEAVESCWPVFKVIGENIVHSGGVDSGNSAKR